MNLLDLPQVILMEIFEYLTYDDVAKNRIVSLYKYGQQKTFDVILIFSCFKICKRIDMICQQVLNRGFNKAIRQHGVSFKRIKALLPRRESERRNHYLARHADILTSIETRISMLSMTYNKYMELSLCCFIPGRVLDEIFRILHLIATSKKPLRPHEVLQELRDISSMAIEHFDEKIATTLKKAFTESSSSSTSSTGSSYGLDHKRSREDILPTVSSPNTPTLCCDTFRLRLNSLLNIGGSGSFLDKIKNQHATNTNTGESGMKLCNTAAASCPNMKYFKKLEIKYRTGIIKVSYY